MTLLDANILLYAYDRSAKEHDRARSWLEDALSSPRPVRLAWATILAFLRIGTDPRALFEPLTMADATAIVGGWLAQPHVALLEPGDRHWEILQSLLQAGQARSRLVMDAHLAALAIEHGATLCTNDRDFARFPNL
ncbi:MAG: TA system VapC family ribonuclease toxin, partial [Thermoanaerobaculia bacterium]